MENTYVVTGVKKIRGTVYSVFFNGDIKVRLSDETIVYYKVKEGRVFEEEEYEDMISKDHIKRAKTRGLDLLSRSSKSKSQIKSTLKREEFQEKAIEEAIRFLEDYQFVNDATLAGRIVESKAPAKKWSKNQTIAKIKEKGISKDDIENAIKNMDTETELENALDIAKKKLRTLKNKSKEEKIQKIRQSLAYRGFDYDIVSKVMDEIKREIENCEVAGL
ncbi:regulatory protein [Acetoanaerobium pronyense]|uniref:Regulatory protein RecX n=1 Tax=Acetoanaerobium pronyense TaxID=1482736 RepID=A0ABS4KMD8_9FIRM|nr:regulatory protein RecX [Acetoanaerobium pronyense]MBP2028933.1 regulatory protein [Acetoanaerobium pronyense]